MQNTKYKIRHYNVSFPEIADIENEMNNEYNNGWKVHSTNVISTFKNHFVIMVVYENMRNNIICD